VSPWGYEYEEGEPVGRPLTYAEILCVATEEGQAGNTYDVIYYTLHPETCSPELLTDFGRLDVGLTRINLPDRRGFIEPVTSADTSADGAKSTFIVADETHLWILQRLHRLHGVMTRNLLKRKVASGWMLETSTMYAAGEGSVAEGTHAYAQGSSRSRRHLLFDHRQASESWDISIRKERLSALREAYGPAAAWMNLEAIADSYDDPQVSHAEFCRFWLNQPVPLVNPNDGAIDAVTWADLLNMLAPAPTAATVVLDVSPDRRSASIGTASEGSEGRTLWMVETAGGTAWVVPKLKLIRDAQNVLEVALNPRGQAAVLIPELIAAGIPYEELKTADLGASCAQSITDIEQGRIEHVGQTELDAAVMNARTIRRGEVEVWDRRDRAVDISPLVACSAASYRWGIRRPKRVPMASFV
jgi:hypothetical protein